MATLTAGTPSRHVDPTRRAQAVAAWVLALPFVLLFLAFTAGPVLASLGMSFTDFRRADIRSPLAVEFVGLSNYVDLVQDPLFRKVTVNTLLYLLLGVPLTMAHRTGRRGRHQPAEPLQGPVPGRLLPAGRDQHRGGLGGLEVPATGTTAGCSTPCSAGSASRGLNWLDDTHLALPVAGADGGLAHLRHPDGDLPGRAADHPARDQRGGGDRRRRRLGAVPAHHAADAAAHAALRRR